MNKTIVLFRFDATAEIGMGHAYRMKALSDALSTKIKMDPVICGEGEGISYVFPDVPIIPKNALSNIEYDFAIQDILQPDSDLVTRNKPLVIIDDFGGPFKGDIILNGSVLGSPSLYPHSKTDTAFLCGGQYALLRPEFGLNYPEIQKKHDVVMIVGSGVEASNWVSRTLVELSDFSRDQKIVLIVGKQFIFPQNFDRVAQHVSFYQSLQLPDLITILRQSRLALTCAGMMLYELSALGIPFLAFPSVPNQLPELDYFESMSVTKNIININNLEEYLHLFLEDKNAQQKTIAAGKNLVDGLGAMRAADMICSRLKPAYKNVVAF